MDGILDRFLAFGQTTTALVQSSPIYLHETEPRPAWCFVKAPLHCQGAVQRALDVRLYNIEVDDDRGRVQIGGLHRIDTR
jgi:hypothetical protein